MKRILGLNKPYTGPTLDETSTRMGDRAAVIDKKIMQIEQELTKIRDQIKMSRSKVQQDALKKRALPLLKQKKMYEQQRDSLYGQQANLDQAMFAHVAVKDSIDTVQAMKHAQKQMKKDFKKLDIGKLERMQDDMSDLLADANDIQEVLSRSYDTPNDYVDDDELLMELDALDSGDLFADEAIGQHGGGSSYLDDIAMPSHVPSSSSSSSMPQQQRVAYGVGGGGGRGGNVSQQQLQSLEDELGLL